MELYRRKVFERDGHPWTETNSVLESIDEALRQMNPTEVRELEKHAVPRVDHMSDGDYVAHGRYEFAGGTVNVDVHFHRPLYAQTDFIAFQPPSSGEILIELDPAEPAGEEERQAMLISVRRMLGEQRFSSKTIPDGERPYHRALAYCQTD